MGVIGFRRFGYYLSIATLVGLAWLSQGPANLPAQSQVAFAASDPVIAAAGDIACDPSHSNFNGGNGNSNSCRQRYTSELLVNANLAAVLLLGDNQYYCGGYQAWLQSYDLSWGRVKSITRPSVGNHEYLTSGGTDCTSANAAADGYFRYFGSAAGNKGQGYYSFNIGAWHLVALNSNCSDAGGCGSSSPQGRWLQEDLAAHSNYCTLAYWHIPLFSSGGRAASNTQSLWQTLYNYDVDVVLNGHDHIYERFAPQAPNGTLDTARGIRQFIVGTGGANHTSLASIAANSEVRNTGTFGVLKLTLHPTSYDWQFVPEAGKTFSDSGTGLCHGSGQTVPTSTPTRTSTPVVTGTATPTGPIPPQPGVGPINTATYSPIADSYVSETSPTTNYGSSNTLRTDGSPLVRGYMRFDVQNLVGRVTRATLRVYANSSLSTGYDVRSVPNNTWGEMTINYNNAPTFGSTVGSSGPVSGGQWTSVDLTSLISGNGTYNIAITSSSSTALSLASRNASAANQPQLVVEVQSDPTPTPSPTATPTDTATSTATQTATDTPTSTPTPTDTATNTPTPTATGTPTATPSSTSTPTETETPTPTASDPGTDTPTASQTDTETPTATVADPPTETPTPTETPISSEPSTDTPTPQGTETPTATSAEVPTDTATSSPTLAGQTTDTPTATETATPTASDLATETPTSQATETPTATSADLETGTPTSTDTETSTPTPSDPVWETATATETETPTSAPTEPATATPTPVDTATATPTPVDTETPTATATFTPTPSELPTDTATPTSTDPATSTPTATDIPPTATATATSLPTPTNTATFTPAATATSIPTPTRTPTLMPTPTRTATPTPGISTFTFNPAADSYVDQSSPSTNYGTSTQLRIDGSPLVRSYLRFNVQNVTGRITRVTLRVYANSSSSVGYDVRNVTSSWSESSITYSNAPPFGSAISASGSFSGGVWTSVNLTSLVTANGTYNIALTTASSTAVSLASRQAGANAPQLIIETMP